MYKNDDSNPKRFMFRKKRVKQPSTLKKQILKERLRLHEQSSLTDEGVSGSDKVTTPFKDIFIFGLVDDETNLRDSDEITELINNVKELFGDYGLILTVDIAVTNSLDGTNTTVVIVTYSTKEEAQTAVKVTDKLILGGSTIRVLLHPSISHDSSASLDPERAAEKAAIKSNSLDSASQIAYNLLLWNTISEDDLDSPDVIEESLQDILSLCRPCRHKPKVDLIQHVSPPHIHSQILLSVYFDQLQVEYEAKQTLKNKNKGKAMSTPLPPLVIIETGHIINTLHLGSKLNGIQIGGEVLQSRYFISHVDGEDIFHFSFAVEEENTLFGLQISHPEIPPEILLLQLQQEEVILAPDNLSATAVVTVRSTSITITHITLSHLLTLYESLKTHDPSLIINFMVSAFDAEQSSMKVVKQVILGIQGYLTTTDLQDSDEEELLTAKQDLLKIISDLLESSENEAERAAEGDIQRLYLLTPDTGKTSSDREDASSDTIVVQVGFTHLEDAQNNLLYFEGLVIGGQRVTAQVLPAPPTASSSTVSAAHPLDNTSTELVDDGNDKEHLEVQRFYDLLSQPKRVLYHEDITLPPPPSDTSTAAAVPSASYPARKISQYILAKQAPKLGYHPTDHHLPIPHATEEINLILKEFLTLLSTFQLRLRESKKSALVFKQKQRFVTGIKQATNAVKAGKVKLLIIAPNTEAAEAIDEKLSLLINTAQVLQVPVLYALSKRLLGKALQMSMKQSVVAVFIPDGAYEQFRKVLAFLRPKD